MADYRTALRTLTSDPILLREWLGALEPEAFDAVHSAAHAEWRKRETAEHEADKAARPAEPAPQTVRIVQTFGACKTVGVFLKATDKTVTFRTPSGEVKRWSLTRRGDIGARMARETPHTTPCTSCADHPETRFPPGACMHGNPRGSGECESCLSM